jgi:hypothetical protein
MPAYLTTTVFPTTNPAVDEGEVLCKLMNVFWDNPSHYYLDGDTYETNLSTFSQQERERLVELFDMDRSVLCNTVILPLAEELAITEGPNYPSVQPEKLRKILAYMTLTPLLRVVDAPIST